MNDDVDAGTRLFGGLIAVLMVVLAGLILFGLIVGTATGHPEPLVALGLVGVMFGLARLVGGRVGRWFQ